MLAVKLPNLAEAYHFWREFFETMAGSNVYVMLSCSMSQQRREIEVFWHCDTKKDITIVILATIIR